jgi:hypothetical protein
MVLIRALAIHLRNAQSYEQREGSLIEKIPKIKHKFKTKIWTTRIVFPKMVRNNQDLEKVVEKSEDLTKDLSIDYVAIPLDYKHINKVHSKFVELFSTNKRTFFSVNVGNIRGELPIKEVKDSVKLIKEIFEKNGEEACTRFAISFGGQPETAYFPDTASRREGFSISLRYVNDLLNELKSEKEISKIVESIVKPIQNEAFQVQSYTNARFLGIDLALSPWMKESVMKLIEEVEGISKATPGFYTSIWKLNEAIIKAKGIKKIGFNEVMLPVAEDSVLKKYFTSEKMKISELIGAISVCVAGLDMIAISTELKDKVIEKIILDSITISKARKKKIGIRIILTNSKAGKEIKLGRFGKVPVVKV